MKAIMFYLLIFGNILAVVFWEFEMYVTSTWFVLAAWVVPGIYFIYKVAGYGSSPFTPGPFS